MAGFIDIKIEGQRELSKQLEAAEKAVSDRAIMAGLRSGALIVMRDAKRRAPFLTGTLRRSITQADVPNKLAVKVGTNLIYGPRIEYGFTERDKLGRRFNQAARPFMRPALVTGREEVRDEVIDVIKIVLRRAV